MNPSASRRPISRTDNMTKFAWLVICVLVALTRGDDSSLPNPSLAALLNFNLIPQVATVVKTGCPNICTSLNSLCHVNPKVLSCSDVLVECDKLCKNLDTCIVGCGPNCDVFETNCNKHGVAPTAGVFCPMIGKTCDVSCMLACPQKLMADLVYEVVTNLGIGLEGFANVVLANLKKASA